MATYQVVPYLISVKPRSSRGAEVRPLDDLDGRSTKLVDLISQTLVGAQAVGPFRFPRNEDTSFQVGPVSKNFRTVYFTVTQGSRGIESRLNDAGEIVFERRSDHIEDIDFRNVMIFPAHGKHAVLLTERIGNRGVASFLGKLIVDTMRQNFHDVTTEVRALTTAADLTNTNLRLKGMDFRFPLRNDPSGRRIDLSGPDGFFSLNYKFRAEQRLSNFTDDSGAQVDPSKVFGVLNTALTASGLGGTGETLKELGVEAEMHVLLPSGHQRSFTLGTDEGPALAYTLDPVTQAGTGDTVAERYRPTDEDFLRVAKEAVSDVAGSFGIGQTSATYCEVPNPADSVVVPTDWRVVWNVPDHLSTDSS